MLQLASTTHMRPQKREKKTHLDPLLSLPICLSEKPGFLPLAAFLFNRN